MVASCFIDGPFSSFRNEKGRLNTGKWVCPSKANENFIKASPLGLELCVTIV